MPTNWLANQCCLLSSPVQDLVSIASLHKVRETANKHNIRIWLWCVASILLVIQALTMLASAWLILPASCSLLSLKHMRNMALMLPNMRDSFSWLACMQPHLSVIDLLLRCWDAGSICSTQETEQDGMASEQTTASAMVARNLDQHSSTIRLRDKRVVLECYECNSMTCGSYKSTLALHTMLILQ